MVVAVSDIRTSKEHKGYIEWRSDWNSAYRAFIMKGLTEELNSIKLPEPPRPSKKYDRDLLVEEDDVFLFSE